MSVKKFYKIENRSGEADIMIYGEIGDSFFGESITARELVSEIKDLEKKYSRINVRINSPGGSVFDGLAIFNALQNSTAEVHTWNDGLAASMGALILMAGQTVHAAKNSLLMIHSPSTGVWGNAKDLRDALDVLEKVQNSLIECLMPRTKKTRSEIETEFFDYTDHWLSADEALKEGFIDEIIESPANVSQKAAAKAYQEMVAHLSDPAPEKTMLSKIAATLKNIFIPEKQDSPTTDSNLMNDMDIKTLQVALSLGDTATETDVLAAIIALNQNFTALKAELANEKAARKTAEDNLTAEQAITADQKKKIEDLEKEPGSDPAKVDPDPTPEGDPEPENFFQALASVRKILKK